MNLPNPTIISDHAGLTALAHTLAKQPAIAFDTESNSLFAYHERVCLIQVTIRDAAGTLEDYVIDSLAIYDLEPLRPIFADPTIQKVFHAAEYDLVCLKRDYHFTFANLFDTMFAARITARKQFGLGALLEEFFQIQADKRYQKADWSLRPIPPEQLQYAQQDTHYLLALRDFLQAELDATGRAPEAAEMFEALTHVPPAENTFDAEGYWRIHAARDFNRREMAVLRELYLWRDDMARANNVPAFKIMGDNVLCAIIASGARSATDIGQVRELSSYQLRRYTYDILGCIEQGLKATPPTPPPRPRAPDPEIQARYDVLHGWRKERAAERSVESDVILSKESMWAMARKPPATIDDLETVPGLGPWRREKYGLALLHVLSAVPIDMTESTQAATPESNAAE